MKRKFNWLDGLICGVLALAILAVGGWYLFKKDPQPLPTKTYDITVRFTQTTTDPYDFYEVGDTMYFHGGELLFGKVTKLESMDLISESLDTKAGKFVQVVNPQWKSIQMTIRAEATMEKGSLKIDSQELFIGKEFYPQSEKTRSVMTIWDIEEVE